VLLIRFYELLLNVSSVDMSIGYTILDIPYWIYHIGYTILDIPYSPPYKTHFFPEKYIKISLYLLTPDNGQLYNLLTYLLTHSMVQSPS